MTPQAPTGLFTLPPLDPAVIGAAITDQTSELILVLDNALDVVAVNQPFADLVGIAAIDLLGTSAMDLMDPADHERAFIIIAFAEDGSLGGSAPFGLRCADGTIVQSDVAGCTTEVDGTRYLTLFGRPTYMVGAIATLLDRLLQGQDLAVTIEPLLEFFAWRENRSQVAITWWDGHQYQRVHTGLPSSLAGMEPHDGDPWEQARITGEPSWLDDVHQLAPTATEAAQSLGLHTAWVQPVGATHLDVPALITAWTAKPGLSPKVHSYGMSEAERYLETVLRWTDQVARLDAAANRDALTGLANRRAFFEALHSGTTGGAVLYCDLDGFKPVNDQLGHAAGDALLAEVGHRILAAVREHDLVARVGGDEFAVLLWDATHDEAHNAAKRLRAAFAGPFSIQGHQVTVGISVGVGHEPHQLSEHTVEQADAALYRDKNRSR